MTARTEAGKSLAATLPCERKGVLRHVHGAAVAGVVLLAIALRLYRLKEQSLWWDDFIAFGCLNAPDLQSHLRFLRVLYPEHGAAPLYYVLQYWTASWTGMNAENLRLLPVALSASAVPLLYGFVRYLCGRKAALLAALCLALSPQHIWYAQEIRTYELVTPLAVVSVWSFMRAYRGGRPAWWAVTLIANTALVWTYLLMVFLILAEGLFLLAFSLRRFRRVALWSAVQLLLLAPSAVSVLSMTSANSFFTFGLSFKQVFNIMLGGDVVLFHPEILPGWKTHGAAFATFPCLIPLAPWFSLGLLAAFTGASAWAVVRLIRSWRQQTRAADPPQTSRREFENMAFLLLLFAVPGLAVMLLGAALNTLIFPSYLMYNQLALYAIAGTALMAFPVPLLRRGASLALIGLYVFQLLIFLPEVTRTNWKEAAAHIRNNASAGDQIIDVEHIFPDRELAFYLSPDWPVRVVETFQAACDDSARILQAVPDAPPDGAQTRVWIVFQPFYLKVATDDRFDGVTTLLQAFQERGLRPSIKEFPGQNELVVCVVERCGVEVRGFGSPVRQIEPRTDGFGGPLPRPIDYNAVLDELGFQTRDEGERRPLSAALRESVDHWPLDERFPGNARASSILPILDLACRGHGNLAEAAARNLLGCHPDYGLLHMALGVALLKENKTQAAQEAFASAGKRDRDLGAILGPFTDALAHSDDLEAAWNEARKLEKMGFWYAPALRAVCRPDGLPAGPLSTVPSACLLDGPSNKNR